MVVRLRCVWVCVVLWMLLLLLLLLRWHCIHSHVAVLRSQTFGLTHDCGGEMRRRHHDWCLHALLTVQPHLAAAAALLCYRKEKAQLRGLSKGTRVLMKQIHFRLRIVRIVRPWNSMYDS